MSAPDAIVRYAERFHRVLGADHHVASPLGAWLLLALVAPASSGDLRAELESALGCDAAEADAYARSLLSTPHPAVALAAAAWSVPSEPAELRHWLDSLRPVAEVGPMPTQAEADAWAADKTLGLIQHFPVATKQALLTLASAIATKISWDQDFTTASRDQLRLAPAPGFDRAAKLLSESGSLLVDTTIGPVGVHTKFSREGDLAVVAVIADPAVAAADVLAVAHPLAVAAAGASPLPGRLDAVAVPDTGHCWTVEEYARTVLPAWSARSRFDLAGIGVPGIAPALHQLGRWVPGPAEATQVALARYTRTGFEAAAVTVVMRAMGVHFPPPGRELLLEFTHPYAVVAVACGEPPWAGLPVFSAWITRADDTDPE